MSDLDWPVIVLAAWVGVSGGLAAHRIWTIWRPSPRPNPGPVGIQILHSVVDDVSYRHALDPLPIFYTCDTACDVFAAASNHLDHRRRP